MKIVKHLWHVIVWNIKRINCKHADSEAVSCPFTKLTYTTCNNCKTRIKVELTNG